MTEAPEVPLEMRRNGFDPIEELARARDDEGVVRITTPFGVPAYLMPSTSGLNARASLLELSRHLVRVYDAAQREAHRHASV